MENFWKKCIEHLKQNGHLPKKVEPQELKIENTLQKLLEEMKFSLLKELNNKNDTNKSVDKTILEKIFEETKKSLLKELNAENDTNKSVDESTLQKILEETKNSFLKEFNIENDTNKSI
ncbi:19057_t:CDS:2 [Rhizophagus irregularis]|nr:19057_t:CDS:2 [Rhizophagus irregularis]